MSDGSLNPARMQYKGKFLEDMTKEELVAALVDLGNLCLARDRDEDDAAAAKMLALGLAVRTRGTPTKWAALGRPLQVRT